MMHPFKPVFDKNSSILILGTFPSKKSREYGFFYGHPRNRFWKLIAHFTNIKKIPESVEEKKEILLKNKIALWDIVKSCDITGSSDTSIINVIPNDLLKILSVSKIQQIYANGTKAYQIYMKYAYPIIKKEIIKLPSTSPANAAYSFENLISKWKVIFTKL